jgi:glycosyltransferase involved in cell wall biosynthesis
MTSARVITEINQGYGHALRRGLREATGDFVIMAEPDGTFVARDVHKLLAYADDFDMVCGTRTTRELIWEQANMGRFPPLGQLGRRQVDSGAVRRTIPDRLRLQRCG